MFWTLIMNRFSQYSATMVLLLIAGCAAPPLTEDIRPSHHAQIAALDAPWSSIGRVTFRYPQAHSVTSYIQLPQARKFHCTGTLIGPREVLTAAHCLWDTIGNKWGARIWLSFDIGPENGRFGDTATIVDYRILETRKHGKNFIDPAVDWAVLTLNKNFGERYGYLPITSISGERLTEIARAGATFVHAAYSVEEPRLLAVNENCEVPNLTADIRVVLYRCSTADGDSGSPILLKDGDSYAIVAVHSGAILWQGEEIGVGVPIQDMKEALGLSPGPEVNDDLICRNCVR